MKYKSPLRWPGGKSKAIPKIVRLLPERVAEYREPFCGAASVLFHARNVDFADKYWINDAYYQLMNFWAIAQDFESCDLLVKRVYDRLDWCREDAAKARTLFESCKYFIGEDFPPTFKAGLFFMLNRMSWCGATEAGGFSAASAKDRFTASSIERLKTMPAALDGVKITCMDFQPVIEAPGKDVFLFLDPPYISSKKLYGPKGSLHEFDHARLAKTLADTNHRFLLTYDDEPEIHKLYHWANIRPFDLQYGMVGTSANGTKRVGKEIFITNY
jgi:DNA adenine methylase